jgi:hypothetical protein
MFNKSKFLKYFIILIGLIILLLIIFYKPTKFTLTEEFIKNNKVSVNSTKKNREFIENVTYVGLFVLDIDSVEVNIFDIPVIIKRNNFLDGYIIKGLITHNFKNNYTIYLDCNEINTNLLTIISHELIHLKQYQTDRLKVIFGGGFIKFDGKYYFPKDIKYNNRPWEIEAFDNEYYLTTDIKSIIY